VFVRATRNRLIGEESPNDIHSWADYPALAQLQLR
jgi:hypothetical protein